MGRKPVRAQRKFAQGAYIPPQNNPASSAPPVPPQASHRAIKSTGPVLVHTCSARDLLTRLSLEKGHFHERQPVVRLEYIPEDYYKKVTNKKSKDKKTLNIPQSKRAYSLRNRRKSVARNVKARRSSDSGEENKPLSFYSGPNSSVTSATAVEETAKTTATLKVPLKRKATKTSSPVRKKTNNPTTKGSIDTAKKSKMNKTVPVTIEESPEVVKAVPATLADTENSNDSVDTTATAWSIQNKYVGKILLRKKKKVPASSASPVPPKDEVLIKDKKSSAVTSKKRPLVTVTNQPSGRSLRLRRPTKAYLDNDFSFGHMSDVASLPGAPSIVSSCDRRRDPDYVYARKINARSTTLKKTNKLKALKRKFLNNERLRSQLKTTEPILNNSSNMQTEGIIADTKAVDKSDVASSSRFSGVSSQVEFNGFEEELPELRYEDDEPEDDVFNLPNVTNKKTADWVRTHYEVNVSGSSDNNFEHIFSETYSVSVKNIPTPENNLPESNSIVPGNSTLPTPAGSNNVTAHVGSSNIVNTPKNCTVPDDIFKMPELPKRFVKRTIPCFEEKKEPEKSRQRLRSAKPSCSRGKKAPQSQVPRLRRNQPIPTPVNTDTENSKDTPSTSSTGVAEPQPIVYLLHIEDDPKLEEHHRTAPLAANSSPLNQERTVVINDTPEQTGANDSTIEAPVSPPSVKEDIAPIASTSKAQPQKQKKTLSSSKSSWNLTNNTEENHPSSQSKMEGAPVFRPTLEEFKDPITYIKSIEQKAGKYGICKIVPPKEYTVACYLNDDAVFSTMNQYLGRLYQRWGPNTREMTAIQTYVAMIASPRERDQFTKVPVFEGVELDLVRLYHHVLEQGGIEKTMAHSDNWTRIAEHMSLVSPRGKFDQKKLEKLYFKHVLPYESLSNEERNSNLKMVDIIWGERSQSAIRRAKRPLHYQKTALGETTSDDDETPLDPDEEVANMRSIGKPCFDRAEECMVKGRTMNLTTFRRIGNHFQSVRSSNRTTPPSTREIEEEYWNILTKGNEHVCVLSAFVDTSVDNLGHTADLDDVGGVHPWNLKRIGENPLNILRPLGKTLSVTVPTLSLNQLFSTNCWHMDPHQLGWMDYMHEGATKIWYAVPAYGSNKLRDAVASIIPSAAQNKGIWLASDTTMVPLEKLLERGVPVFRLEQKPGEFIVVFPGAYASSIATGLTISESIYFEDKSYLFKINKIFQELRQDCEPAMFSSTLLLIRLARDPTISNDLLRYVYSSLEKLIKEELELRLTAVKHKWWIQLDQGDQARGQQAPGSWPNQEECSHCRAPLILSKMYQYNHTRSLMCLSDGLRIFTKVPAYESGMPAAVTLLYSNEELQADLTALANRLNAA